MQPDKNMEKCYTAAPAKVANPLVTSVRVIPECSARWIRMIRTQMSRIQS